MRLRGNHYDEQLSQRWAGMPSGWRNIKVVVDVIAGTSAGKLNGGMLRSACSRRHDGPVRRGAQGRRSGPPSAASDRPTVPDSTTPPRCWTAAFLTQLEEILAKLAVGGAGQGSRSILFTASGLGQQQFEAEDAAGQPFVVPDHRYLYRFSSERRNIPGDGSAFENETTNELVDTKLLARASRSSASFPAAFEPVLERPDMAGRPPSATGLGPSRLLPGGRRGPRQRALRTGPGRRRAPSRRRQVHALRPIRRAVLRHRDGRHRGDRRQAPELDDLRAVRRELSP